MKTWVANLWDKFTTGFWFVPSLAILIGIGAGTIMPELDRWIGGNLPAWLETSETTARSLLTALIGAMFTVTGIVFSVSVVTLSITASQLGPRLLRTFMEQAIAQLTLGVCLATSIFCLLLLRACDRVNGETVVPHISVFLAIISAAASLCIVVLFMHRVTVFIQAPNVVEAVAHDLDEAIDRLFPEKTDAEATCPLRSGEHDCFLNSQEFLFSACEGYLQAIDFEGIVRLAKEQDLVLRLCYQPGDFLIKDLPLAQISRAVQNPRQLSREITKHHLFGPRPLPRDDVKCSVRELVEMAVRALSPGINDPFTAEMCIDRLKASLIRLSGRRFPGENRFDEDGKLRVVAKNSDFSQILACALDPLRQHALTSDFIYNHLLDSLDRVYQVAKQENVRNALIRQINRLKQGFEGQIEEAPEQVDAQSRSRYALDRVNSAF